MLGKKKHFLLCSYLAMIHSLTCQRAKKALAANAVPHEEGVGHTSISKLHVDALRAQPHLQVAELQDWMAVSLLQPVGELASAGRKWCEVLKKESNTTDHQDKKWKLKTKGGVIRQNFGSPPGMCIKCYLRYHFWGYFWLVFNSLFPILFIVPNSSFLIKCPLLFVSK